MPSDSAPSKVPITLADQAAGRIIMIADDLQDALANKTLAPPGPGIITDKTRVVLYGCDVGRSTEFPETALGSVRQPWRAAGAAATERVQARTDRRVEYRQAQSWTLVRNAPLIPAGADSPTAAGRRSALSS